MYLTILWQDLTLSLFFYMDIGKNASFLFLKLIYIWMFWWLRIPLQKCGEWNLLMLLLIIITKTSWSKANDKVDMAVVVAVLSLKNPFYLTSFSSKSDKKLPLTGHKQPCQAFVRDIFRYLLIWFPPQTLIRYGLLWPDLVN